MAKTATKPTLGWGFYDEEKGRLVADSFSVKTEATDSAYACSHKLVRVEIKKYTPKKK